MRIIAGDFGGRTLVAPIGRVTRPTTDRVREALFSILGDLHGARVLDLFAGTGALGLEALSRGAATAVFVESAREPLRALRDNIASLALTDRATVLAVPVERLGKAKLDKASFDIVFADPPYVTLTEAPTVKALGQLFAGLKSTARIVVEHSSKMPPPTWSGVTHEDTRIYGDTALSFYACASPAT